MSDRAVALWRRFSGMFGSEALSRKFGDTPPEEWRISIDRLKDYELERGMKRLVFSGKSYIPSLPEFLRLCREVASDQFPDEQRQPLPQSHRIAGMDAWTMAANRHLMGRVMRRVLAGKPAYTDAQMRVLLEHRTYWAAEMREAAEEGAVPEDNGLGWWNDRMALAEQQMAQREAA